MKGPTRGPCSRSKDRQASARAEIDHKHRMTSISRTPSCGSRTRGATAYLLISSAPTLLAPFRTRTTHIVHLGLIRSSRPLFSVRQLGDLANGSPGVDDGALNSARGNKDSYIVQLRPSIRFASVTDCMQSVVFPSAFRILARAKIGANRSRAFSSAHRTLHQLL
jgi:hypothetical protein